MEVVMELVYRVFPKLSPSICTIVPKKAAMLGGYPVSGDDKNAYF